jgi:flagellin-like protein
VGLIILLALTVSLAVPAVFVALVYLAGSIFGGH